jgi:hypothetical protein
MRFVVALLLLAADTTAVVRFFSVPVFAETILRSTFFFSAIKNFPFYFANFSFILSIYRILYKI